MIGVTHLIRSMYHMDILYNVLSSDSDIHMLIVTKLAEISISG